MNSGPEHGTLGRKLRDVLEPIAGSVYFAPHVHEAYESLGFGPSRGVGQGAMLPDRDAYYWSRGAALGDVPGETVAAAFAIFNPLEVIAGVARARQIAGRAQILAARLEAVRQFLVDTVTASPENIERATQILRSAAAGASMAGRPLFAGLASLGFPGDRMGDFFRAADLMRELRGDAHVAAWSVTGLSGPEMAGLNACWTGINPHKFIVGRHYPELVADRTMQHLEAGRLVSGRTLTDDGLRLRREIEASTDRAMEPVLAVVGPDLEELIAILEPISAEVVGAGGYFNKMARISELGT